MAKKYIRFFNECALKDVALVGGKGANLGELTSAGFPVPAGFGITSDAFDFFLTANRLDAEIRRLAAQIDFTKHGSVAQGTSEIRKRITDAHVPDDLVVELREACMQLGENPLVAVRSSSAVPTMGISSFPGQMDTVYNIRGLDDIVRSIKLVWASLWAARAAANRWNKGVNHFAVKVSALVQQMIASEFSGVAFTANPISGADEIVVEAIPGLGEDLVLGKVNPDCFIISKGDTSMRERPQNLRVPEKIILQVGAMAQEIETHYGRPQDIEWAWAGNKLYILQSRSIQTRAADPHYAGIERWNKPPEPGEEEIIWTRAWSDEVLTRAITPLFYSVQADLITATYDFIYRCYGLTELLPMKLMRFHKNRGYFSTKYLKECLRYAPQFARSDDALKFFTPEQKEEVRTMPFRAWRKLWTELRLALLHSKYSFTKCHKTYYKNWLPELLRRVRELDKLDLNTANFDQLHEYFQGMDWLIKEHCRPIGFGVMVHTFGAVTLLTMALEKWLGEAGLAGVLLSGLPGNNTVEFNQRIWELSRRIRKSPRLMEIFSSAPSTEVCRHLENFEGEKTFIDELEDFRRVHDFRGAEDREISFPRWGDDPTLMYDMLKIFVQAGDEAEPEAGLAKTAERRERTAREITERLAVQPWGFLKKLLFRFLLKYAQIYSLFRENQRYEVDRVFYGERKAFVHMGRLLAQHGRLASEEDVWFLSKNEIFDLMRGTMAPEQAAAVIGPRREEYRRYLYTPPAMFLQGDHEFNLAPAAGQPAGIAHVLTGVAASAGQATGVARVVHDIRELGRVQPGDILVTNSTDPGWTPVFMLIRGLVLETGGILAHGTVLSREYGIPAVTSLKNATTLIKDGDQIILDGGRGTVILSADPAAVATAAQ